MEENAVKNADTAALTEAFEALSKSAAMVAAALRAENAADAEAKPQPKEKKFSAEKVRGMLAAKAAEGFKAEVKQIVNRFGKNFTAISPEDYPAVVEELSKLTEKAAGNE